MKFELKSIGYWSVIRISFIVNLILGLVMGVFFALFMQVIFSMGSKIATLYGMSLPAEDIPPFIILIILYPIMFGFGGAIFNTMFVVVGVFVYNMIGKFIGGLELEMSEMVLQPVAPVAPVQQQAYAPPPPPPVQPLPPEMTPPEDNIDNGNRPPRTDEGI